MCLCSMLQDKVLWIKQDILSNEAFLFLGGARADLPLKSLPVPTKGLDCNCEEIDDYKYYLGKKFGKKMFDVKKRSIKLAGSSQQSVHIFCLTFIFSLVFDPTPVNIFWMCVPCTVFQTEWIIKWNPACIVGEFKLFGSFEENIHDRNVLLR